MHIIFDDQITEELRAHYTLLELDTFKGEQSSRTAYCVIDAIQLSTEDLFYLDKYSEVHAALISNYKKGNTAFCFQALDLLRGKWGGQLDSFYQVFAERIPLLSQESHD